MIDVWEFNENLDTPKSYQAFCVYRDLGISRSTDQAYDLYRGHIQSTQRASQAPGFFTKWRHKGEWDRRAQAYDLHTEKERRSKFSEDLKVAYEKRLEAIRNTAETIALDKLQTSRIAAQIVLRLMKKLGNIPDEDFTDKDFSRLMGLVTLLKLDAGSIESALKITDEALDIRSVLEHVKGES